MIPETEAVLGTGLRAWDNKNKLRVLRLHWSADPTKDEAWADEQAKKYGGRASPHWQREYEINFKSGYAGLVFPEWNEDRHVMRHQLTSKEIENWPKWRFIDPGYTNACAVGFFACNDSVLYLYDEIYVHETKVSKVCELIKAKSGRSTFQWTGIDPSAFARGLAADGKRIADLFFENGIAVNLAQRSPIKRDQIEAARETLSMRGDGVPYFRVGPNCVNFRKEIKNYRWKVATREDQAPPEEPVKKNDHLVDTWFYCVESVNPRHYSGGVDPLKRWYDGTDPRKRAADDRRIMSALPSFARGGEPD